MAVSETLGCISFYMYFYPTDFGTLSVCFFFFCFFVFFVCVCFCRMHKMPYKTCVSMMQIFSTISLLSHVPTEE